MTEPSSEDSLKRLDRSYHDNKAAIARLKNFRTLLTLTLVAVLLGYLYALYARVTSMYTLEKFQPPLERELQKLAPKVSDAMVQVVKEVGPTYMELGQKKFEQVQPQLGEEINKEWANFSQNMTAAAESQIGVMFVRLEERHTARIRTRFPELSKDGQMDLFKVRWIDPVEEDMKDIMVSFHDRYVKDIESLQASIEQFRPNQFDHFEKDHLIRHWIHLWLMLLDRHVLELDKPEPEKGADDDK